MNRLIWLALRIAAAVALIVATCGYAITGNHTDVLLGVGCAVAIGVGVGLRGKSNGGPWVGILIGSIVGVVTAFLAGALSVGWGVIIPPLGPLAVGLIGGLDRSSLSGYRDVARETFVVAVLLSLGFIPALVAGDVSMALLVAAFPLVAVPWGALLIGLISRRRDARRASMRAAALRMIVSASPRQVRPQRQNLGSYDPRRFRPDQDADYHNRVEKAAAQIGGQDDQKGEEGQDQNHVHPSHQNRPQSLRVVAGQHSDSGPDNQGDRSGHNPHHQRNPGADNQFRQKVLSNVVGAENVPFARR